MYKYTTQRQITFELEKNSFLNNYTFKSDFITIYNSKITIPKGYSWDGCTPSWKFLGKWWGTPDTAKTYLGSLLHDSIYQHKKEIEFSRADADFLLKFVLQNQGFKLAKVYYTTVNLLGGIMGDWKNKVNHNLKLKLIHI